MDDRDGRSPLTTAISVLAEAQAQFVECQNRLDGERDQLFRLAPVEKWLEARPDLLTPGEAGGYRIDGITEAQEFRKQLERELELALERFLGHRGYLMRHQAESLSVASSNVVEALVDGDMIRCLALLKSIRSMPAIQPSRVQKLLAVAKRASEDAEARAGAVALPRTRQWHVHRRRLLHAELPTLKNEIELLIKSVNQISDTSLRELRARLLSGESIGDNVAEQHASKLAEVTNWIEIKAEQDQYVDRRRAEYVDTHARARQNDLQKAIRHRVVARRECVQAYGKSLADHFLDCDPLATERASTLTGVDLADKRLAFVENWSHTSLSERLDIEQVRAVASTHDHTLVTARAGSGKTRTLIARAAFLVRHCGVQPGEILMLAFNKKAAEEMRRRLETLGVSCPHVMTFHALAYTIVHPEEALIYDDPSEDAPRKAREFDRILQDFVQDLARRETVRQLMLAHFRHDWARLEGFGAAMSRDEGLAYRRSLEQEALDGTRVKSFGEKVIANFLFEHGIPYGYEWNRMWGDRNYKPDFTLRNPKIVIEYFGMQGTPEYDEQWKDKRQYWKDQPGWTLLEYTPELLTKHDREGFERRLADDLRMLGVPVTRLSEEQIWKEIQERVTTRLAGLLSTFIGRCRKALWTPEDLDARIRGHRFAEEVESGFLDLASEAYRFYLRRLDSEGKEDFDGLMARAAELVEAGTTRFERKSGAGDLRSIRFVMIDEYQDFSPLFDRLLSAIRSQNPAVQVFAVGDDWQAINGFAGSDLRYFTEFGDAFDPSAELPISTNYRSAPEVVEVGNRIMAGRGTPARCGSARQPGRVAVADMSEFVPESAEVSWWAHDILTPAVRRLVASPLEQGKTVTLLARQGYLPFEIHDGGRARDGDLERLIWNVRHGMPQGQQRQLDVSTAHSYKGKEADVVLVLDAVERRYPKIHPDWVFARIFGDSPDTIVDDERRLFYVACSRAAEQLIILTDHDRRSPFLEGLEGNHEPVDWKALAPRCPSGGDWLLQVGNVAGTGAEPTKSRAGILKQLDFNFRGGSWPHWWIAVASRHPVEMLRTRIEGAAWVSGCDGLDIRLCHSDSKVAARWVLVDGGLIEQ